MIAENARLRLADDVTFQSVAADQTVVLSLDSGQLYTCNETSAALLSAAGLLILTPAVKWVWKSRRIRQHG